MKKRATETNPFMASLIGPIKLVGLYSCRLAGSSVNETRSAFTSRPRGFNSRKKSLPRPDRASANQNAAQPETPPAVK
jgi:hypothetical protein